MITQTGRKSIKFFVITLTPPNKNNYNKVMFLNSIFLMSNKKLCFDYLEELFILIYLKFCLGLII